MLLARLLLHMANRVDNELLLLGLALTHEDRKLRESTVFHARMLPVDTAKTIRMLGSAVIPDAAHGPLAAVKRTDSVDTGPFDG